MRDPSFYVSGFLDLHKLSDPSERRATWRQSLVALARATTEDGHGPLDGLHPDALVLGVRVALADGLVDSLDFLAPSAAGAALYELASALPVGPEQRDLGRRVMSRLLAGNADEFVTIATRMALGASKGLGIAAARARISLVTELPLSFGISDGPLALALTSRRELSREWIVGPSIGSLSARRLAARLLERAAREAARRASQGDDHAVRIFTGDAISQAWERLLADRESLVWRHVAVARGLLAPFVPAFAQTIEASLDPTLTPTEWRRGAASVAAWLGVDPEAGMRHASHALTHGFLERDKGAAAAFAWGIPRAAESEPEAAGELLDWLIDRAPHEVSEAITELRMEFGTSPFVERASLRALFAISKRTFREFEESPDDGAIALSEEVARDLDRTPREDRPIRDRLLHALHAYVHDGARAAYQVARGILDASKTAVDGLEAITYVEELAEGHLGSGARKRSLAALRDLDIGVLERDVLADLLRLASTADAIRSHEDAIEQLRDRLTAWLLEREAKPLASSRGARGAAQERAKPDHPMLRLRRLRALLHVVDGDVGEGDDSARTATLRARWSRVARSLVDRFEKDPPSVLRRTTVAALARAIDALVRGGACDVSDAMLVLARHVEDPVEFETLAEASMNPDFEHILSRYAAFTRAARPSLLPDSNDSIPSPAFSSALSPHAIRLRAFEGLARDLARETSGRTEALRTVLVRLHAALSAVSSAASLRALSTTGGNEPDIITSLESALAALTQLALGARGRLDPDRAPANSQQLPGSTRPLSVAISRVLAGSDATLNDHIVSACLDDLVAAVPKAMARLVSTIVWGLVELPITRPSQESTQFKLVSEALPAWVPPRRTLGGFYVIRALSSGAVGSVFVVSRVEDRHDQNAERFALKVPEYSATAARSVSESEFMKMFREEASALITVPAHSNLARFVTFDLGAKPKPILVMELVEGMTLERLLESGALDVPRAVTTLDQVLAGLEAMHRVGVGHLDLKPSNVVVRKGEEAVLVDFGLAGRKIRPGCATGPYGAPEVWGASAEGAPSSPTAADMYAFGCLVFEVMTGAVLFNAESEMAQIAMHVSHDGFPAKLRDFAKKPGASPVAEYVFSLLRRDPRERLSASAAREELKRLGPRVHDLHWPL